MIEFELSRDTYDLPIIKSVSIEIAYFFLLLLNFSTGTGTWTWNELQSDEEKSDLKCPRRSNYKIC